MRSTRLAWAVACALCGSAGCGGGSGSSASSPSAPLHVAARGGDGVVTIRWDAVAGATSYAVYWASASGVSKASGRVLRTDEVTLSHTGLTNGATYYYVV